MTALHTPNPADDQRLLIAAQRDNPDALKEIYQRYFPSIYRFVRLRLGDRSQAQDITADVFLDFFIAARRSQAPQSSVRAWLYRVARNKLVDHFGRQRQVDVSLEEWLPDPNEHSPEANLMRTAQISDTQRALRMLPAEQQEVLLLRFAEGLNLQETADLMNKSVSAIKSLQFRAVDRLRQILNVGEIE